MTSYRGCHSIGRVSRADDDDDQELPPPRKPARDLEDFSMSVLGFDHGRSIDHQATLIEALVARGARREAADNLANAYAGKLHLFAELAHVALRRNGRGRGLDPRSNCGDVVRLALSTTDFLFIMGQAFQKVLLPRYENASAVYRRIAARRDLKDFRAVKMAAPMDFPSPRATAESGERRVGSFTESGETGQLISYSSRVALSRQTLVNDDAGVFSDLAIAAAARCVDLEEQLFFTMLTSGTSANGPTLRDTSQLFASGRGNLAASGALISATTISAARAAVMGQESPNGVKSVAVPRYLVCPPALLTLAEVELAKLNPGADPSQRITPIASAYLSGTAWYLVADPSQRPFAVYSYLAGASGPVSAAAPHFETEGLEVGVTLDFGVTAVDARAIFKNPGA